MNRLDARFAELREKGEGAFIPFLVIGDPDPGTFLEIFEVIEPHADVIELGIPYTDPVADGPAIQEANARAFASGMNLGLAFELMKEARARTEKPLVILTYANVVGIEGKREKMLDRFSQAGIDGLIIADVPLEEADPFVDATRARGLHFIFLVSPATSEERVKEIISRASGYIYIVAVKGVTGARRTLLEETSVVIQRVTRISRKLGTGNVPPACVGFGLSRPEHVEEVIGLGADGAIVGSAIINKVKEFRDDKTRMLDEIGSLVAAMKEKTLKKRGAS